MSSDNQVFAGWYTDTADIYRLTDIKTGNITKKQRVLQSEGVACRVYSTQKNGPVMKDTASRSQSTEKLSCDLSVDIRAGDELQITRGGALTGGNRAVRYFAGSPQQYYDPVGGALSGLQHQEVGLLKENLIG